MSSLRQLDICALGLRDLSSVFAAGSPLTALTGLRLDGNHTTSLGPLAGLSRLLLLSMNNNRPSSGGTSSCCSLSFAAPAAPEGASCSSPSPLLPNLQTLHLAGCGLTSLVPLQLGVLPALRALFIQGNDLTRLDGLEGCGQLRELVADRNKLR
jgi:Leucine-rich repeat (LRR) protein